MRAYKGVKVKSLGNGQNFSCTFVSSMELNETKTAFASARSSVLSLHNNAAYKTVRGSRETAFTTQTNIPEKHCGPAFPP